MDTTRKAEVEEEFFIPAELKNTAINVSYRVHALIGTGGFARCYSVTEIGSNAAFAAKIISKQAVKQELLLQKVFKAFYF